MFIGVAKGELGKFCQAYLRYLGTELNIEGPLTQIKDLPGGKAIFRIQRSRDVPRWIGSGYDFGITGNDVTLDEIYAGNEKIGMCGGLQEEAKMLGFEKLLGKLVLLGREGYSSKKDRLRVVVSDYYPNIARRNLEFDGLKPGDYELKIVQGAVEGYLSGGDADLAVETRFNGDTLNTENEELDRRGKPRIEVVRNILDITPLVIYVFGRYTWLDFDDLFYTGKGK